MALHLPKGNNQNQLIVKMSRQHPICFRFRYFSMFLYYQNWQMALITTLHVISQKSTKKMFFKFLFRRVRAWYPVEHKTSATFDSLRVALSGQHRGITRMVCRVPVVAPPELSQNMRLKNRFFWQFCGEQRLLSIPSIYKEKKNNAIKMSQVTLFQSIEVD